MTDEMREKSIIELRQMSIRELTDAIHHSRDLEELRAAAKLTMETLEKVLELFDHQKGQVEKLLKLAEDQNDQLRRMGNLSRSEVGVKDV